MATIITGTTTSSITPPSGVVLNRPLGVSSSTVLGLPSMVKKVGRVRCSIEGNGKSCVEGSKSNTGMGASLIGAVAAAACAASPAMALVDERMSTEGTGLPFGLSNNLLGWILFGVFGLIWTLYFIYASSLDEDDDSGLSL